MSGFNWGSVLITVLAFVITGILAFIGWLWKESIYGKIKDQKDSISEAKVIMTEYVKGEMLKLEKSFSNLYGRVNSLETGARDIEDCKSLRDSCSKLLLERFISFEKRLEDTRTHFDAQVISVINGQAEIAKRIDNWMLQEKKK